MYIQVLCQIYYTVKDKKNATFIAAIFIHFRYTKHGIWYTKMLTRLWSFLCENFISLSYASQFLLQIEIAAKKWRFPKIHTYFFKSDLFFFSNYEKTKKDNPILFLLYHIASLGFCLPSRLCIFDDWLSHNPQSCQLSNFQKQRVSSEINISFLLFSCISL